MINCKIKMSFSNLVLTTKMLYYIRMNKKCLKNKFLFYKMTINKKLISINKRIRKIKFLKMTKNYFPCLTYQTKIQAKNHQIKYTK